MRIFFPFVFCVSLLLGQFDNSGTSAANFLKIGVGGRATAMGGAITGQVDDPTSLFWNPAGIANARNIELAVNHNDWIFDLTHSYIAAVMPAGRVGHFGLSINYLDMGKMERTTELAPEGDGTSFSASDIAIGFAYAKKMSDRFNVGIQLKMIQESISFSSARAVAIDAGSQYITRFSGLKIGIAITNFGSKLTLNGTDQKVDIDPFEELDGNPDVVATLRTEDWPLPMAFRMGLSFQPLGPESLIRNNFLTLTVNTDYYDSRDLNPYFVSGVELKVGKLFYLRSGTRFEYLHFSESYDDLSSSELDDKSNTELYINRFSWGFGLSSESFPFFPYKMNLDYSVSDLGILGITSQFGLTFKF